MESSGDDTPSEVFIGKSKHKQEYLEPSKSIKSHINTVFWRFIIVSDRLRRCSFRLR